MRKLLIKSLSKELKVSLNQSILLYRQVNLIRYRSFIFTKNKRSKKPLIKVNLVGFVEIVRAYIEALDSKIKGN